eukprot:TRINITY_DN25981_c0_g1_i1.p1 TRINITY_DN25981_c0_g1~~TRINITY_DN25981_c0_g1_i1.p1  ORF type:complete len:311 (+),score=82.97 TRINITY_DN25981_c0_g1_i1:89-1021(+)
MCIRDRTQATAEKERKEMSGQITLLTATNSRLAERLKEIEESADVIKTTATIAKLNDNLRRAQEVFKHERESRANTGFRLHTLLDATKTELKERDGFIAERTKEYEELVENHNRAKTALANNEEHLKRCDELMQMTSEDMALAKLKFNDFKEQLSKHKDIIEEQNNKISELEVQLKLQREGLVQTNEVSMDGTLFYFICDNSSSLGNTQSKHNSRTDLKDESLDASREEAKSIAERIKETGEVRLDTVSLRKYTYAKPMYRALVDHLLPQSVEGKVPYDPPFPVPMYLSLIHICRCRRYAVCRSRWSPYH